MNIVFSGLHGTGKSTIAKMIAEHFNFTFYSTGILFRELAAKKGMSLEEFSRYSEENPEVDRMLDDRIIELAEESRRTGEGFVFDGQLPAYLLKDLCDYAILLKCDDKVRVQRMALRDGRSIEDQLHETLVREESERNRFKKLYNIDIGDSGLILKTYHLIIDTTFIGIDNVFEICKTAIIGRFSKDLEEKTKSKI